VSLDLASDQAVLGRLPLSAYDLPTRDKLPVIRELLPAVGAGLALDIGVGTGYTTYSVFGRRPTVCVDLDAANLRNYRDRVATATGRARPLCVVAQATALPLKAGSIRFVLCSEVLEHIADDDMATGEMARVLTSDGIAVITVPYTGLGFTSFLEFLGVKTVHDFPGPEHHVRPGYDERSLAAVLGRHGLEIARHAYYFRFFTRLVTDAVSIAHLLYQRIVHRRRAWTWADVTASEQSPVFRIYTLLFPLLWGVSRLDRLLRSMRGFGLVAKVKKRGAP
jgi:ubiquinone/menaquinone biosynthesis C-methylase UbiE